MQEVLGGSFLSAKCGTCMCGGLVIYLFIYLFERRSRLFSVQWEMFARKKAEAGLKWSQ